MMWVAVLNRFSHVNVPESTTQSCGGWVVKARDGSRIEDILRLFLCKLSAMRNDLDQWNQFLLR